MQSPSTLERDRAPAYLLGLQDELDEMGQVPDSVIPSVVLLIAAGSLLVPGLVGVFLGEIVGALPWILSGILLSLAGSFYMRRTIRWFRHRRSLQHGIDLIHSRQLEQAAE